MKAVRTENSNHDFGPPDGKEDEILNLPCQLIVDDGGEVKVVRSVWVISDEEREYIANGGNIELDVYWIGAFPPVSVNVTDEKVLVEETANG